MTAHLPAGPVDLTCPRCTRQTDPNHDVTWTDWRMWHTWCYRLTQLDRRWLERRQPETVLLGEERP